MEAINGGRKGSFHKRGRCTQADASDRVPNLQVPTQKEDLETRRTHFEGKGEEEIAKIGVFIVAVPIVVIDVIDTVEQPDFDAGQVVTAVASLRGARC